MRMLLRTPGRLTPIASIAIASAVIGASAGISGAAYTVTNVSTAVTAAGAATATSNYGSGSLSSDGSKVAGLTSTGKPFLYVPATNTTTILSSFTAITVAVNNSGTFVGGNNTATTPNFIYKNGTTTTVVPSAIANQNATASGTNFVAFTGINNAGTASGFLQYLPAGSYSNEGITYGTASGTGQDVGSSFSNQLATQARGDILYSINDSGVGAGFGAAPGTGAPLTAYTATPNGSGGYTYKDLGPQLRALASGGAGPSPVSPVYVGIDSNGDVAGSFTPNTIVDGFLYDATTNTTVDISANLGGSTYVNGIAYVNGVATVVGVGSVRFSPDTAFAFTKAGGYQTLVSYIGAAANGYTLSSGLSISSKGDILALGTSPTGVTGEYLFSVPEPTSAAFLALGGLAALRRRRSSASA